MPIAFLTVGGYAVWKGLLEGEKLANPLPPGNWTDDQGHRVVSTGNEYTVYDDKGNVINQQKFPKPYSGAATQGTVFPYGGTNKPLGPSYTRKPEGK